MRRAFTLAVVTLALPVAAHAQSTLERLEAVAVEMNALMNEGFIAEIPALEGNLPDPAWDEPMRTAYTCMYTSYVDAVGEGPVADMVTAMETELETLTGADMIQGGASVDNPEGISDETALQIVTECQLMDVFMQRMTDSGAMAILTAQQ